MAKSRKQLEEEIEKLRNEAAILRTLIDHMPDYIYVKDTESKHILSNPADVRLKGKTDQTEVLGKTDFDFFPQEIAGRLFADDQDVIRTGKPLIDHRELVVDQTTGAARWLSTTKVPWIAEDQIRGLIGMGRDSTARRTLHNITLEIASQLTGESLLDLIVDRAVMLLEASNGGLYRYHPEEKLLRLVASKDRPNQLLGDTVKASEGIAGQLVETREPYLYVPNYKTWPGRIERHAQTDTLGAVLAVLLEVDDDIIGVLYINAPVGREFTRREVDILRSLGAQAAVAIRNAALFAEIQRQNAELKSLQEFAFNIVSEVSLDFRLNAIVDAAIKLLGGSSGKVYLLDENQDHLVLVAVQGRMEDAFEPGETISLNEGVAGELIRSKKPFIIENNYPKSPHRIEHLVPHIFALIEVPLIIGEEAIGVLEVYTHDRNRTFSQGHDTEILMRLAQQAALAIHDARLVEDAKRRLRDLEIVQDIARAISTQRDTDKALETIVKQIRDNLDCTHCTIFLAEQQGSEIVLLPRKTSGVRTEDIKQRRFKVGEGIAGMVFKEGESIILRDARQHPKYIPATTAIGPRSMIASPVRLEERIIGVITADQDEHGWFTNDDLRLLDTVAGHTGIALALALALDALERARRINVFISYCHEDKEWLEKNLLVHLKPLQDKGLPIWTDKQIRPGEKWGYKIKEAISTTRVAVLLLTPEFVASDYITKYELPPLIKAAESGEIVLYWILVSPCNYEELGLADYQAANNPERPLIEMKKPELNRTLTRIAKEIETLWHQ
jgi:PAS domain S-box-containing protein